MRSIPTLLITSVIALAAPSARAATDVVKGAFDQLVCTNEGSLALRDDSMKVIGAVARFEQVKVVQGWNGSKKKQFVNGKSYDFVKIQLIEQNEADAEDEDAMTAWVPAKFVKPRSTCAGATDASPDNASKKKDSAGRDGDVRGLNDPKCCAFPLAERPTSSYLSGMRMFGAGRSRGKRVHAAADLYGQRNDPILAVAPGKVARKIYYFYQGTYALEVVHQGGFVVRYGEITAKTARGIKPGAPVRMGQTIGYMGKVRTRSKSCCEPMLHFELFSGAKNGALSQKGNKFQRRSDLMNPTKHLQRWEQTAF